MTPNLEDLYIILQQWAAAGKPQTYTQLSHDYHALTGEWYEAHGSWDEPLGKLNNRLANLGAPALSALVVLQTTNAPGGGFWGCPRNVPPRPKNDFDRVTEWTRIVSEVIAYPWPHVLPRIP